MASNPLTDPEWAERSVDFIDRIVSFIRDHTTKPIIKSARGLVFGLLAAFGLVALSVLFIIAIGRGLQAALDAAFAHETAVWMSYFILSALFALIGTLLMKKRHTKDNA